MTNDLTLGARLGSMCVWLLPERLERHQASPDHHSTVVVASDHHPKGAPASIVSSLRVGNLSGASIFHPRPIRRASEADHSARH